MWHARQDVHQQVNVNKVHLKVMEMPIEMVDVA